MTNHELDIAMIKKMPKNICFLFNPLGNNQLIMQPNNSAPIHNNCPKKRQGYCIIPKAPGSHCQKLMGDQTAKNTIKNTINKRDVKKKFVINFLLKTKYT